ncbi:MAG TPA: glucose-6-phosphate isomerase family protein [Terriglobia bacterium]|nr:glucose-6-phosphate isomerase family protein [Terriglobia bacterium]
MRFDPALDVKITRQPMGFEYGLHVFGPKTEYRSLDAIRWGLFNPACQGPDPVYAIAMGVGKEDQREELCRRNLLFGVVTYAAGRLGGEPVRSPGHLHKVSRHNNCSAPEIFEIWEGCAVIYMQEFAAHNAGRCFEVEAKAGDVVVVPPAWAHAAISTDPTDPLTFGAWCDRDYGFVYDELRARKGLAWYPVLENGSLQWQRNTRYQESRLEIVAARTYPELGLPGRKPIYARFEDSPESVQWVSEPQLVRSVWPQFHP